MNPPPALGKLRDAAYWITAAIPLSCQHVHAYRQAIRSSWYTRQHSADSSGALASFFVDFSAGQIWW